MRKTKAEEYEALNLIRGILKDFDPNETYVGKAFEGCVEQAKQNIDNDWMFFFRSRYENRDRDAAKLDEILTKTTDKLRKSEEARVDLTKELNQKDDAIARLTDAKNQLNNKIDELDGELDDKDRTYNDLEDKLEEEHQKLEKSQAEILRLKAKLYDMMTGKEVEA